MATEEMMKTLREDALSPSKTMRDLYAAIIQLCDFYVAMSVHRGAKHMDKLIREGVEVGDIDDHVDMIEFVILHAAMSFSDSADGLIHEEGREIFYELVKERTKESLPEQEAT